MIIEMSMASFQRRVVEWLVACFGEGVSRDKVERNHRFLEEALELVQSTGCTASEAHQLVDYVYGRPVGETKQEVGGVAVTFASLCAANDIDMGSAAETELARVWTKIEQIRAKQAAKPKYGPLPIDGTPSSRRHSAGESDPHGASYAARAPAMLNGMTEEETAATASVAGLSG